MSIAPGLRTLLLSTVSILCLTAGIAHAQNVRPAGDPAPQPPAPDRQIYLARNDFYFEGGSLVSGDRRYQWTAHVGLDVDVADYRTGRVTFQADTESVLGRPSGSSRLDFIEYGMSVAPSYRTPWVELAVPVQHRCRHLSDQANSFGISWDAIGIEARRRFTSNGRIINTQINVLKVIDRAYADYAWTSELRLSIQQPLSRPVSLFGSAIGTAVGVTKSPFPPRDRQYGAHLEAGMHFVGSRGAFELFVGYERRIDAFPLARQRSRWVSMGFRLLSK